MSASALEGRAARSAALRGLLPGERERGMVEISRWESRPEALGGGWEGDDEGDGGSSQRPESREKRALGGEAQAHAWW